MTQISLTSPAAVTILLERSKIFSVAPGISSYVTVAIHAESVAATVSAATDFGPYLADREVTLNLSLGTVVYEVKDSAGGGAVSAASIVTALDAATPADLALIQASVSGGGVLGKLRLLALSPQDPAASTPSAAPTITLSAAGASPSIPSARIVEPDDPLCSSSVPVTRGSGYPNDLFVRAAYISDGALGAGYTNSMHCSFFRTTDAPVFEFQVKGGGQYYRIWWSIAGKNYIAGQIGPLPTTGQLYWVKIDFGGGRLMRTFEIETLSEIGRLAIGPTDSLQSSPVPALVGMVAGDSFVEGTGLDGLVDRHNGFAPLLLNLLGIKRKVINGLGGTGYGATNGARTSLLTRVQTDIIAHAPDVIFYEAGINDSTTTISDCLGVFDAVTAALPHTLQIVFGVPKPRSIDTSARDAILQAAVAARPGMFYIPTAGEFSGTGNAGAPTGTGNSDWAVTLDLTHPPTAGHDMMARWRNNAVRAALGLN